jgi:Arc/MetJ-type ribon-helix-helix transcriptional regulator
MDVKLLPESQRRVEALLSTGEFASAAEVLDAALAAFDPSESDLDEETIAAIDRADKEVQEGKYVDWKIARERILERVRSHSPQ